VSDKDYDYPAADFHEEEKPLLRDAWAHLTLLATGEKPAMSNAEAAELIARAFSRIFGEEISAS
jgi:hypothetical protein